MTTGRKVSNRLISAAAVRTVLTPGRKAMPGKDMMTPNPGAGYRGVFLLGKPIKLYDFYAFLIHLIFSYNVH